MMYQIKTKNISCPNCKQLTALEERLCPHCQADLAIAAVIAERVMTTSPSFRKDEIFEPFHQLDGSSTRDSRGTGLGLALARSIVDAHGSKIKVESYIGQGLSFSFALSAIAN